MGKASLGIGAGVVALAAVVAVAARAPAVEDRLFDRALEHAFSPRAAALYTGDGLNVFFCGTGSPLPSKKRAQTCTAVFAGDRFFIVDAGTGSWENVQAAGIPATKLRGVLLTHFHSDHIGDLSEINIGSWATTREAPLAIYGPPGVERVVAGENEAFALDAGYRIAHHGKGVLPPRGEGMKAVAFDATAPIVVYEEDGLKITAFPVRHDPVTPAVGYRFDYKGRSVAISGDTAYSDSLAAAAKDVDLLMHEAQANHMVALMQRAAAKAGSAATAKIFADIPSYHTSPEDAARIANKANADWLVLTHLTPAPDNPVAKRIFMRGVSAIRGDNIVMAEDGMAIFLPAAGGVEFGKF